MLDTMLFITGIVLLICLSIIVIGLTVFVMILLIKEVKEMIRKNKEERENENARKL